MLSIGALLLAAVVGRSDEVPYALIARLPAAGAHGHLNQFHFDPVGRRVYAPATNGVYWVDLQVAEPRLNGPILFKRPGTIALAPDVGRMYFANDDGFGYLNLRADNPPTFFNRHEWKGAWIVHEPARHEIYAVTQRRGNTVTIYDADTGERTGEVTLPGNPVRIHGAVPGKVFVTLGTTFGLHVIDAATRTVGPWPVDGRLVDPLRLDVERSGQYMIARYERHLVAIDIPSARTVAQLPAAGLAGFAFDPESRQVVVATHEPPDHPRVRLRVYGLGVNGFTRLSELKNPAEDAGWLVSTSGGFLQRSHDSLLFWKARPAGPR